jgi:hypothetical protein
MTADALHSGPRSRRALLAAAVGGVGALAAEAIARPLPAQAASAALMTEVDNPTTARTSISAVTSITTPGAIAFETNVGLDATAIHGDSPGGVGVFGTNDTSGAGVVGNSNHAVGVLGQTGDPAGYPGLPTGDAAGVMGYSDSTGQPGVLGLGDVGVQAGGAIGVFAVGAPALVGVADGLGPPGQFGTGVYGYSGALNPPAPPDNIAIYAHGDGASLALRVQGKAVFSRSGRTSVTAGHASRAVAFAGVTTSSLVIATLQTYRSGIYVAAAVPAAGKFTIYLNKAVTATTYIAFFILN